MKLYLPLVALLTLIPTPLIPKPVVAAETQLVASEIEPELKEYARSISVKVAGNNKNNGSGVIIGKQGDKYLVITNNHVIGNSKSLSVQTADGANHQANIVDNPITSDDDIALLTFSSTNDYQLAELNSANTGEEAKQIYAVGFSAETGQLVIEPGAIERIPNRPFKEGYQIGYTNKIVSGMSGGAIFDNFGDLVGINGIGAFPILNTAYQYEDETTPTAAEIEQFRSLSWGLSVHRLLTQLNSEIITAYSLPLPETKTEVGKTELTGWLGELETKAKQITVRIDSSSGANGSGVIIAKEGNTYTVLTADHVLCEKDDETNNCIDYVYEILTPDGQKYSIDANTVIRQEGVDLAVFKFNSQANYQVAELANYPTRDDDAIFVAGYPKLGENPQWRFSLGYGFEKEQGLLRVNVSNESTSAESSDSLSSPGSLTGGYEMVYTSVTYGGMSGGAVLDREGRVIGIHGLAEGETALDSQSGSQDTIQLGYSLGIPVNTFIGLTDRLAIHTQLPIQENQPRELDSVEAEAFEVAILGTEISQENATAQRWLERGNQLWRLKRYAEAVEAFDKAIALNPEFIHLAYYGKGLTLAYQEEYELALANLEQASKSNPNFALAFENKGKVLRELDRLQEALVALDNAIVLKPKNTNLLGFKGSFLLTLKRYSEAELAFTEAIKISPRSVLYNSRGLTYREQGKLDLALADFNQALQINPQNDAAYDNRGSLYQEQGKLDLALSDYNQAVQINPNYTNAYNGRGLLYLKQEKFDLALADFNQALQINPQNVDAYNNRGLTYREQEKLDLALADYTQAIQINPNYTNAYYNRASLYQEQGKLDLALADYTQAIQINPQNVNAYNNRGLLYKEQGKLDLALADYTQAIQINPNYTNPYYNRASLYKEQGRFDLALADYNRVLQINSQDVEAYFYRGVIYFSQKNFDLALADYNKALQINPNHADANFTIGLLYQEMGDIQSARLHLQKAQKLFLDRGDSNSAQKTAHFLNQL